MENWLKTKISRRDFMRYSALFGAAALLGPKRLLAQGYRPIEGAAVEFEEGKRGEFQKFIINNFRETKDVEKYWNELGPKGKKVTHCIESVFLIFAIFCKENDIDFIAPFQGGKLKLSSFKNNINKFIEHWGVNARAASLFNLKEGKTPFSKVAEFRKENYGSEIKKIQPGDVIVTRRPDQSGKSPDGYAYHSFLILIPPYKKDPADENAFNFFGPKKNGKKGDLFKVFFLWGDDDLFLFYLNSLANSDEIEKRRVIKPGGGRVGKNQEFTKEGFFDIMHLVTTGLGRREENEFTELFPTPAVLTIEGTFLSPWDGLIKVFQDQRYRNEFEKAYPKYEGKNYDSSILKKDFPGGVGLPPTIVARDIEPDEEKIARVFRYNF